MLLSKLIKKILRNNWKLLNSKSNLGLNQEPFQAQMSHHQTSMHSSKPQNQQLPIKRLLVLLSHMRLLFQTQRQLLQHLRLRLNNKFLKLRWLHPQCQRWIKSLRIRIARQKNQPKPLSHQLHKFLQVQQPKLLSQLKVQPQLLQPMPPNHLIPPPHQQQPLRVNQPQLPMVPRPSPTPQTLETTSHLQSTTFKHKDSRQRLMRL